MSDLIEQLRTENETLRERVRQLEQCLMPEEWQPPVEWGLTTSESRLFAQLLKRDVCSKESLMMGIYASGESDVDTKIIDVWICKIRAKTKAYGVIIETLWGRGYSLKFRQHYQKAAA